MQPYETNATIQPGGILTLDNLPFGDGQAVHVHVEPAEPSAVPPQPFTFGLHQGQIWMSDDFDAPLPDSFWLPVNQSASAD